MAQIWTIRAWKHGTGSFVSEYEAQTPAVQAAFDKRMQFLSQAPSQSWREPFTKQLDGDCDGLVEIRFKADRVQQRPLGYYGPKRGEFTLLLWAVEKNDRFSPADACTTAIQRRNQVEANADNSEIFDVE